MVIGTNVTHPHSNVAFTKACMVERSFDTIPSSLFLQCFPTLFGRGLVVVFQGWLVLVGLVEIGGGGGGGGGGRGGGGRCRRG